MANSESDFVRLSMNIQGDITIDLEHVVQDPIWRTITSTYLLADSSNINEVFHMYIQYYLSQDKLLRDAPITCGPGVMTLIGVDKV